MDPWIKKYAPKTLGDVHGQSTQLDRLKTYIETYKKQKKRALLLYGPIGSGKTSSVHALANDLDLELIEINASDSRNKENINLLVGGAVGQQSLFNKGKIILVDEVDGISGMNDRGGLPALLELIGKSTFPFILTANDITDDKFSGLRKTCELLQFDILDYKEITLKLKEICNKEKIDFEEEALSQLARESGGDLRAAINDLQVLSFNNKLTKKDLSEHYQRETKSTIQDALTKIFKTKNLDIALPAFEHVDEDVSTLLLWFDENIPLEYKKNKDLKEAFEVLALADIFFGRIRRWQYYRFYVYIYDLLTAGIALSKEEKYPGMQEYKRSSKPLKIWIANNKNFKKKSIAEKLAQKTHTSKKRAFEDVNYLKPLFKMNKKQADHIAEYLDLNTEEIDWLKS